MSAASMADPVALWESLDSDQQKAIGAAALALELSLAGAAWADRRMPGPVAGAAGQRFDRAQVGAGRLMMERFAAAFPALAETPPFPDLNPLGVRMCRSCGCIEEAACSGGCSWVGPTLCSACKPEGESS